MRNEGILMAVSGFSGAGKGTIMKRLLEKHPSYVLSVSATTRKPRQGEQDGVHYFFKTEAEFQQMIEEDAFLEHAGYTGHRYGTPKAFVEENLKQGKDVILEIDVQGALKVKENHPELLLIFVTAPSIEEIHSRLEARGSESEEVIKERIAQIEREIRMIPYYDYLIVNKDVEESADALHKIVEARKYSVKHNKEFIEKLTEELQEGK